MFYVYLIRSTSTPSQTYIGYTEDLRERIATHNRGGSKHTSKYMPWELITYHAFTNIDRAKDFERYLKTGPGQAFAKKRFW